MNQVFTSKKLSFNLTMEIFYAAAYKVAPLDVGNTVKWFTVSPDDGEEEIIKLCILQRSRMLICRPRGVSSNRRPGVPSKKRRRKKRSQRFHFQLDSDRFFPSEINVLFFGYFWLIELLGVLKVYRFQSLSPC